MSHQLNGAKEEQLGGNTPLPPPEGAVGGGYKARSLAMQVAARMELLERGPKVTDGSHMASGQGVWSDDLKLVLAEGTK